VFVIRQAFIFLVLATVTLPACRKAPAGDKQTAAPAAPPPSVRAQASPTPATPPGQPGQPPAPPPAKPVPQQLPEVVARVNGEDVKKADFERMINSIEKRAGQPIPTDRRDEIMRGALDQLVVYTLLSQESKSRQIKVEPAEIDQKVQQLRGQFPTEEAFAKALKERGMTVDSLKHDAQIDLSVTKLMDAEMAGQTAVTDQEAKDFYDKNPERFKQGESVRASHILIRVDENADAAARKKAKAEIDAVLKQVNAGGDFAKLAQEHSQDGSAAQGGDLNYFPRGQMVPAFDKVAFSLKPGQVSGVVQTQFGYHIIKVSDHKAARTVSYEEASGQIKQFLTQQRQQQHADEFIAVLKKKSKIEVLI
jgi:peptidyl-prolyl cis-trans isomerase C